MKPSIRLSFITAILMLVASHANAEIVATDSLEWLAVDSPAIIKGAITDLHENQQAGSVTSRDITIKTPQIIKGDIKADKIVVRVASYWAGESTPGWLRQGDTCLIFL